MPGKKHLAKPCDVVYLYDGSFEGFLCCVHQSVYTRQIPAAIWAQDEAQPTLFEQRSVETDREKAARVLASIPKKLGGRMLELVRTVFLSCMPEMELGLLRLLLLAYEEGPGVLGMLGHPVVAPVLAAERHLLGERHLLLGFVRFADYGGVLVATITPKNFVLPFLASHFTARYPEEEFIIYDKAHGAALVCKNHKTEIVPLQSLELPQPDGPETLYRDLWKRFYHTISIKERENHKCRRTHMPKRYWENMTEMRELL